MALVVAGERLGDVQQARQVLDALHVARQPQRAAGVAGDQVLADELGLAHASTQVSFEPPPCDEFTTSEPAPQRDARQAAGQHPGIAPGDREGTQVDVARFHAVIAQRRTDREPDHRLADVVRGIGLEPVAELVEFGLACVRADQQAIATRLGHRLHHQLVQMIASVYASPSGSAQIRVSTFCRMASSPR